MTRRRRLLGGPVGIVFGWTALGALLGEQILEAAGIDPDPPVLVIPSALAGVAFAGMMSFLRMAIPGFDALSLARAVAWGALGGLLIGLFALLTMGSAFLWPWGAAIAGFTSLGGASTAAVSLASTRVHDIES